MGTPLQPEDWAEIISPQDHKLIADVPLTLNWGPRIGTAHVTGDGDGLAVTARLDPGTGRLELADDLAPLSFAFGEPEPPGALARLAGLLAPWRR